MDRLRLLFVLPVAVSVIANVATAFLCKTTPKRAIVLVVSILVTAACVWPGYHELPELVCVPDLQSRWRDEAANLCRKHGLKLNIKPVYGERSGYVLRQSPPPGTLVEPSSAIEASVCIGQPVVDPSFGVRHD